MMQDEVTSADLEGADVFVPLALAAALSGCAASVIEALGRVGVVTIQKREVETLFSFRDALRLERELQAQAARKRELVETARLRARRRRYAAG